MSEAALLEVQDLVSSFHTDEGWVRVVDGVSWQVCKGRTVGVVGESGCGKTVSAMSVVDLLPKPSGQVLGGKIWWRGENLREVSARRLREVRGGEIGVVFQEPMAALNPVQRVGRQVVEAMDLHLKIGRREALKRTVSLFRKVGLSDPQRRLSQYPHELSGGMKQRVGIAMALAAEPRLLIADEPTTALDVTVQAQILKLLQRLQRERELAVLLITHDLGVIAQHADEVVVMYAGRVVERAPVRALFGQPQHAYTQGLLASIPRLDTPRKSQLPTIPGQVASPRDFVAGCRFCQRLGREGETLRRRPRLVEVGVGHWVEDCPECWKGGVA